VAIGVDEVILHEHFEESCGPKPSNDRIERMYIFLEVSYWNSIDETFNQNRISCLILESLRKHHTFITSKMSIKGIQIFLLDVEINLVDERLLQGFFSNGNFIGFGEEGQEPTYSEKNVHISLDVLIDIRMADLYRYFPSFVVGFVDLTYGSRSYRFRIEIGKDFIDFFTVTEFEVLFGLFEAMLWGILPQMGKSFSHFRSNYISPMAKILKSLNPNNSGPFNSTDEHIEPYLLCSFEHP
jgi:hypothetical protein